jgi:RNA polymerase-binding transcription factor DksA
MAINTDYFKNKLEQEKNRLEAELSRVGKRNPAIKGDWEATPEEAGTDTRTSEQSELADKFEEFENRSAVEIHLEEKLNEVTAGLDRLEKGPFGVCTVCGEKIDEKRLMANPAAATCVKHSKI